MGLPGTHCPGHAKKSPNFPHYLTSSYLTIIEVSNTKITCDKDIPSTSPLSAMYTSICKTFRPHKHSNLSPLTYSLGKSANAWKRPLLRFVSIRKVTNWFKSSILPLSGFVVSSNPRSRCVNSQQVSLHQLEFLSLCFICNICVFFIYSVPN